MAITIDSANAKIAIINGNKPRPAAFLLKTDNSWIVNTHLTHGFAPGSSRAAITASDAFTATATVPLTVPAADAGTLKNWSFGFIQFQRISSLVLYYAGCYPTQGETIIQAQMPPAMTTNLGRDHSNDPNPPWLRVGTDGDKVFNSTTKLVTVTMGDHPMCAVGTERKNTKSSYNNYLRKFCDGRTFVTVFTARDPQGNYQHLAHFQWEVTWDLEFQWSGWGTQLGCKTLSQNKFTMGAVKAGAPTDKHIVPFLADPSKAPKLGTNEQNAALLAAIKGAPNIIYNDPYVGAVPDDFWK